MPSSWQGEVERWVKAGVIDQVTADRIHAFEGSRSSSRRLRWPIRLAVVFGSLMLAASVLLFVSANWDTLSPTERFAILLATIGGIHAAGALTAERAPAVSSSLHFAGTIALGGGIYLAGQIFHLAEHWPAALLLWAAGAVAAAWLLGDAPQVAVAASLVPAWLVSEWVAWSAASDAWAARVAGCGVLLQAITYFTAGGRDARPRLVRPLVWVGGLALLPATLFVWLAARVFGEPSRVLVLGAGSLSAGWWVVGWAVALGVPMLVAAALRGSSAWLNGVAALWALVAVLMPDAFGDVALYAWFGIGAVGLAAWGVRESRVDQINMAMAIFAFTLLAFYFSQVMDRLGRSASLAGLGVLFLAGGWLLERTRRRLVVEARR